MSTTNDVFIEALRETHDAENLVRTEERWRDHKALKLAEALADGQVGRANELLEEFKASCRDLAGLRIDAKHWVDKLEVLMPGQEQEMPPADATAEGSIQKLRKEIVSEAADEAMRHFSEQAAGLRQSVRRFSGGEESREEVTLFKHGRTDAGAFESSSQRTNSESVLEAETVPDRDVVAQSGKRVVGLRRIGGLSGVDDSRVNVLADVHQSSPSVGAPNGAGVGTSDPTEGDQTKGATRTKK